MTLHITIIAVLGLLVYLYFRTRKVFYSKQEGDIDVVFKMRLHKGMVMMSTKHGPNRILWTRKLGKNRYQTIMRPIKKEN